MRKIDLRANPFFLDDEDIEWVNNTLTNMSTQDKVGQLFCVLYKGTEGETEYINSILKPGGAMYRPMPLKTAVELKEKLQRDSEIPMLIAANLERGGNGIVKEGTVFGSPLEVAATGDALYARRLAAVCAREAKAAGANWAFAPVVDIDSNYRSPITNTRTYGDAPERVKEMGVAYIKEMQEQGLAACAKHFPGDGNDERDQHLVTSINALSCEEWDASYGQVYKACIDAGVMTCMLAHIMLPEYSRALKPGIKDEDILPCSLSQELIEGLLREKLGFNGLIVTDATTMAGYMIPMSRRLAVPKTIAAGADMFLFARNLEEDYQFMLEGVKNGIISSDRLDEAVTRILATKASLKLYKTKYTTDIAQAESIVGCPLHHQWAAECADKAITLVKEQEGVLPISPEKYKKVLFYAKEPESGGGGQYHVVPTCEKVLDRLRKQGFDVDLFVPAFDTEGVTAKYEDITSKYDLIIYVANYTTKSNQTVVRIEWAQPIGADCPHYINSVPTIFISLENPYHLQDVPRIKTYINVYNGNDDALDMLVEKLMGRSEFKGKSPVDPFCGKWDAHL